MIIVFGQTKWYVLFLEHISRAEVAKDDDKMWVNSAKSVMWEQTRNC